MPRPRPLCTILLLASLGAACDSTDPFPTQGPAAPAVEVTESFQGTLTVNGARTHPFAVERAGTVTAQLTTLSDPMARISLSLGTWNGATCAIILANDAATIGIAVVGTAQASGQFCARVSDVGLLTAPVDYTIEVAHF